MLEVDDDPLRHEQAVASTKTRLGTEFDRLLLPYEFSAHSRAALDNALALGRGLDAGIHLLHVVVPRVVVPPVATIASTPMPPIAALPDLRVEAERGSPS